MPNQIYQWYKDDYLISTDRSLLDLGAINDAFDSGLLWWTKRVSEDALRRIVDNSLCLGKKGLELVGLARIFTDYVTIGYLADIYVLPSHQGKGLAPWLMECLNDVLDEWPDLRRFLLLTSSPQASKLYKKALGTFEWGKSHSGKLYLLEKRGSAMPDGPADTVADEDEDDEDDD